MRITIDLGLDLDGNHTFAWRPSDAGGIDVPRTTLERWTAEWEAYKLAHLRWKRVVEEIDEHLYRASPPEESRAVAALVSAARRRAR